VSLRQAEVAGRSPLRVKKVSCGLRGRRDLNVANEKTRLGESMWITDTWPAATGVDPLFSPDFPVFVPHLVFTSGTRTISDGRHGRSDTRPLHPPLRRGVVVVRGGANLHMTGPRRPRKTNPPRSAKSESSA